MHFIASAKDGACMWCFDGNQKGLKQNFHYEINKDRHLSKYVKIFVFYLPYISNKFDLVSRCDSQRHASLF